MKRFPFFWHCMVPLALLSQAYAQTVPDAGLLLQQIERDRNALAARPIKPEVVVPQEMQAAPGLSVTVQQFRFVGNTLLSGEVLAAVVAGYLHRPLGFSELQKAAAAVAERYRQAGWVVRSFLPKQEIDGGIVTIQIVEGRFGKIRLDGAAPVHLQLSNALRYIETRQKHGAPINANTLERSVMLLDDLPGISATSTFHEGGKEGETDLVLKLADTPTFLGSVDLDNYGARSTGSTRTSGVLYIDSPANFGEQATLNFQKTEGSHYGRLGVTLPFGFDGLRVGVNTSRLDYTIITAENQALDLRGSASTYGVEASYPVVRSRIANLSLNLNYDHKALDNGTALGTTSRYHMDVASFTLSGNAFDQFFGLGNGVSFGSLVLVHGNVDLGGSPNEAADAQSTQTAGRYQKLKLSLGRNQAIADDVSVYGQYTLQNASRNLDSSERLLLGGYAGVRAYPNSEGSGSVGQTLTLELRQRFSGGWTLTAFQDWGWITAVNAVNTAPSGDLLTPLNAYSLSGHGLSLGWISPMGAELKATWARRQGDNPNPTAAGTDQDGSKTIDRFWLLARLTF